MMKVGRASNRLFSTLLIIGVSWPLLLQAQNSKRKTTPAPKAIRIPHEEIAERSARDKLRNALNRKDFEWATHIITQEIDSIVDLQDTSKSGFLNSYILNENTDVLDYLERNCPQLFFESTGNDGLNSLQFAAKNGKPKSVNTILNVVANSGAHRYSRESHKIRDLAQDQDPELQRSALHWAVKNGDTESIRLIYEASTGEPLNLKDKEGLSALDYLVKSPRPTEKFPLALAENILEGERYPDPSNYGSSWSWKLLAALRKDPQILMKVNPQTNRTPLHAAVTYRNLETQKFLTKLAPGAARIVSPEGGLPIQQAVNEGLLDSFEELYKIYPEGINAKDSREYNLLMLAVLRNNKEMVERIIKLAPDQLRMKNIRGASALRLAVAQSNNEIIELLAKAAPEMLLVLDKEGETPLSHAVSNNHSKTVTMLATINPSALLVKRGEGKHASFVISADTVLSSEPLTAVYLKFHPAYASKNIREGNYLLHLAAGTVGQSETLKTLISLNPKAIDTANDGGFYPLHLAAIRCNLGMIFDIVKRSPEAIKQKDKDGNLPLHFFAGLCHGELALEILSFPEAYMTANREGRLPIHSAAWKNRFENVEWLAKNSSEALRVKDSSGSLPLHIVASSGNIAESRTLAKMAPDTLLVPDNAGRLPTHLAAKGSTSAAPEVLGALDPSALSVADIEGNLPLHYLGANPNMNSGIYFKLAKLAPQSVSVKNKALKTPSENINKTDAEKIEMARNLEFLILNPDKTLSHSSRPDFKNKTIDEVTSFSGDNIFHFNLDQEESSAQLEKTLLSPDLSEIRYALLLGLSNCPTSYKFENAVITPARAVNRMLQLKKRPVEKTEWQNLGSQERWAYMAELFDLHPRQSENVFEIFQEMSSLGTIQGFENRFIRLTAERMLKSGKNPRQCERLTELAQAQLESYVGKVWRDKFHMDEKNLPMLAKVLSLESDRLKVAALNTGFLPEEVLGEKRQLLNQVVLQCVECHDKEADYPLSLKKEDLQRVPDSPKSTEKTLRAEILRRVELPHSDKAHMPRGKDETLSPEQLNTLKKFLQEAEK